MNSLRKKILSVFLGLVAGGFCVMTAHAEQGSGCGGPPAFSDFDQDGNGFVSEEEFNTVRGQRMSAKAAEGKPMHGAATAPSFADFDTDDDGQLSSAELEAGHKAHMEKRRCMGKGHEMGQAHEMGQGCGKGNGKGMGHGAGQQKGMKSSMPTFSDFDLDGDGNIDETEFNEGHARKMQEMAAEGRHMKHAGDAPGFSGIDTNDDGVISKQEFATHQAAHHHQMQGCKHGAKQE